MKAGYASVVPVVAGTWISLEPGYVVRDVAGSGQIEIERTGVQVH